MLDQCDIDEQYHSFVQYYISELDYKQLTELLTNSVYCTSFCEILLLKAILLMKSNRRTSLYELILNIDKAVKGRKQIETSKRIYDTIIHYLDLYKIYNQKQRLVKSQVTNMIFQGLFYGILSVQQLNPSQLIYAALQILQQFDDQNRKFYQTVQQIFKVEEDTDENQVLNFYQALFICYNNFETRPYSPKYYQGSTYQSQNNQEQSILIKQYSIKFDQEIIQSRSMLQLAILLNLSYCKQIKQCYSDIARIRIETNDINVIKTTEIFDIIISQKNQSSLQHFQQSNNISSQELSEDDQIQYKKFRQSSFIKQISSFSSQELEDSSLNSVGQKQISDIEEGSGNFITINSTTYQEDIKSKAIENTGDITSSKEKTQTDKLVPQFLILNIPIIVIIDKEYKKSIKAQLELEINQNLCKTEQVYVQYYEQQTLGKLVQFLKQQGLQMICYCIMDIRTFDNMVYQFSISSQSILTRIKFLVCYTDQLQQKQYSGVYRGLQQYFSINRWPLISEKFGDINCQIISNSIKEELSNLQDSSNDNNQRIYLKNQKIKNPFIKSLGLLRLCQEQTNLSVFTMQVNRQQQFQGCAKNILITNIRQSLVLYDNDQQIDRRFEKPVSIQVIRYLNNLCLQIVDQFGRQKTINTNNIKILNLIAD